MLKLSVRFAVVFSEFSGLDFERVVSKAAAAFHPVPHVVIHLVGRDLQVDWVSIRVSGLMSPFLPFLHSDHDFDLIGTPESDETDAMFNRVSLC